MDGRWMHAWMMDAWMPAAGCLGWLADGCLLLCVPAQQQERLVQSGVLPRLVSIIRDHPEQEPLVNVCLLALCNLVDLGEPSLPNLAWLFSLPVPSVCWGPAADLTEPPPPLLSCSFPFSCCSPGWILYVGFDHLSTWFKA